MRSRWKPPYVQLYIISLYFQNILNQSSDQKFMVYTNLKKDILEDNKMLLYKIFHKMKPIPTIDSSQLRTHQKRSVDGCKSDILPRRQQRIIELLHWNSSKDMSKCCEFYLVLSWFLTARSLAVLFECNHRHNHYLSFLDFKACSVIWINYFIINTLDFIAKM